MVTKLVTNLVTKTSMFVTSRLCRRRLQSGVTSSGFVTRFCIRDKYFSHK